MLCSSGPSTLGRALCDLAGRRLHGSLSLAFREWEAVCSLSFGAWAPHHTCSRATRGVGYWHPEALHLFICAVVGCLLSGLLQ